MIFTFGIISVCSLLVATGVGEGHLELGLLGSHSSRSPLSCYLPYSVYTFSADKLCCVSSRHSRKMSAEGEASEQKMSAFIVGYTGEVGKALVRELVASNLYSRIVLIGRRLIEYEDENLKKLEQKVVDFETLEEHADVFKGLDVGFCCLGGTRGKNGAAGFRRIDHDYIVQTAQMAHQGGITEFHLTSAMGANARSWLLYNEVKGQSEDDVKKIGFDRLFIYRPAFLLCKREEFRLSDPILRTLFRPINAIAPTFLSVPVSTVARAMVAKAREAGDNKMEILENADIHRVGKEPKA